MMGALEVVPPRAIGRRQRAAALEKRMLRHSGIYNAAAVLRDAWHGSEDRRLTCAQALSDAVVKVLQAPEADVEAAIYALADAICCSPLGTPWE